MTWQNPWAWLGLFTLLAPLALHLLARRPPRTHRFPALRFLPGTRLVPARRTRLTDIPLLFLRLGILAVAAAALAQPLMNPARRVDSANALVRVILVDTSASMQRSTGTGARALDAARADAELLRQEAGSVLVVETSDPAAQIEGAAQWLRAQRGRRELVVISDFQRGTLEQHDFATVPAPIGILPRRVDVVVSAIPELRWRGAGVETAARIDLDTSVTHIQWRTRAATRTDAGMDVYAGVASRSLADATRRAALAIAPQPDSAHAIAVVFADYERRAELLRVSSPIRERWMGDIAAHVLLDTLVTQAAATSDGRLLFFTAAQPGTAPAVRVIAAALEARESRTAAFELEPGTLSQRDVAGWQRAPHSAPSASGGASDGRWLWLIALVLLVVEGRMRARPAAGVTEIPAGVDLERVA